MKTTDKQYKRKCPKCGITLYYSRNYSRISADRKNSQCFSCVNKEENNPMFGKSSPKGMFGKKHSLEFKKKMSKIFLNKPLLEDTKKKISISTKLAMQRPDVKKKLYDSLSKTKWLKSRTDIGQVELLEKWNRLGFNFDINYQIKTDKDLFYLDGYDKEKNIIFEYDNKYHNSFSQKQKDLVRQNKIIDILKPKSFWRYNSETKQFRDILQNQPYL